MIAYRVERLTKGGNWCGTWMRNKQDPPIVSFLRMDFISQPRPLFYGDIEDPDARCFFSAEGLETFKRCNPELPQYIESGFVRIRHCHVAPIWVDPGNGGFEFFDPKTAAPGLQLIGYEGAAF